MNEPRLAPSTNVLGGDLEACSLSPRTGFFRNGCCDTGVDDHGSHTVCTQVTSDFLVFSKLCGNDLSTPRPEFGFSGLKSGDRWCLCAARWREAYEAGVAPPVVLASTHIRALEDVPLEWLKEQALDLPNC
jgi:uncharacterized protein (DUF2237 family)